MKVARLTHRSLRFVAVNADERGWLITRYTDASVAAPVSESLVRSIRTRRRSLVTPLIFAVALLIVRTVSVELSGSVTKSLVDLTRSLPERENTSLPRVISVDNISTHSNCGAIYIAPDDLSVVKSDAPNETAPQEGRCPLSCSIVGG